ncbi:hydrogenase maturation nickel metallochaperone HypA [candidate division KSB1 bacterium]|nr:hydrogenase maturation nickel metallochaperone HypA [candidate division KSB1 bacterium]RQW05458.1 MAG: hydrogenase maturation nickel metallochaperone HypA [candidate division KSB1 bacterium]
MHEIAIAHDIISIIEETLISFPDRSLKTACVSIGEMVAVVPALLQHAYDSLISGTHLDGSKLEITIIPISAVCNSCQKTFGLSEYEFCCPACQSVHIKVKTGNELYVKELIVE